MRTREEVVAMYRVILGREPESEAALQGGLNSDTIADLVRSFIDSDEYKVRVLTNKHHVLSSTTASLDWPGCHVETSQNRDTLELLFAQIMKDWTALGQTEPYYSVLSTPENLSASFNNDVARFLDSGQVDVGRLVKYADRAGVTLPVNGTCLELGCGVGRLTKWLSETFAKVIALDISNAHLGLAEANIRQFSNLDRVDFRHLASPYDLEAIAGYDMFFSVIVLQHNPPPVMAYMLNTIMRGLNPGGLAYFQVPTYQRDYSFEIADYLASRSGKGEMEMHVLPQKEIFRIAETNGCRILEVREDDYTGHILGVSNTFFISKLR